MSRDRGIEVFTQRGEGLSSVVPLSYRACRGILSRRNVHIKVTLKHFSNPVNLRETGQCESRLNTEALWFCWMCGKDH